MVLVGIDTSGRNGSVTLARAPEQDSDEGKFEIVETISLEGGTFSAELIPRMAELLQRNGFSKIDIDGFAVITGPGSFTGLRIGLAAVKGLAEALEQPIAAVSLLEAMAHAHGKGRVLAAMDAGRNELYVSEYEDGVALGDEQVIGRAAFLESAGLKVLTTDQVLMESLNALGKPAELVAHPGSVGAVRLGWEKLRAGDDELPDELDANYVRRSDAEIFAKPGTSPLEPRKA
jgi:tRNA threonylcarbamoyladenosine biosynthesis protein TsaB